MMVDGLSIKNREVSSPPPKDAPRSVQAGTLPPSRLVVDLRAPVPAIVLTDSLAATPAHVQPIPARYPLPSFVWILAGGASVALIAGSLGLVRLAHHALPKTHRAAAIQSAKPVNTSASSVTSTQIKSLLDDFAAQAGAPVYIVVKDLKSGESASVAPDQTITSASLYKLFVAHGIYRQIDMGKLSLSSPVPGTTTNVGDCLAAMLTVSDNTCGENMETMLGDAAYNDALAQYGFSHTQFDYPTQTSAGDVALLLERLYNGTLLSPNSGNQFIDLLKGQTINNRLPQGLPAGTVMAHKTGDVFQFVHDAGIVYGPKTDYLVVVMSGPWNGVNDAPPKFAELSGKLYTLFSE